MFVVGDGTRTFAYGMQYTNGKLVSDTMYGTFVRYDIAPDSEGADPLRTYSYTMTAKTGNS